VEAGVVGSRTTSEGGLTPGPQAGLTGEVGAGGWGMLLDARATAGGLDLGGDASASFGGRLPGGDGVHGGWSADAGGVRAWTDPCGAWPIFYAHEPGERGGRLLVSDSLAGLARAMSRPALDPVAMNVFLGLGMMLGEDTPIAGARVLPPGGTLAWSGGEPAVEGGRPTPAPSGLTFDEAVDAYIELFRVAVARRVEAFGAPRAMLLSGGRDSRHTLFELARLGAAPAVCGTVGDRQTVNSEAGVARAVAEAAGCAHEVVPPPGNGYRLYAEAPRATHLCSDEHAWLAPAFRWLASRTETTMDGIGGDVLSGQLFWSAEREALVRAERYDELAEEIAESWIPADLSARLASVLGLPWDAGAVVERVRAALERVRETPSPQTMFAFWNRTRREVALAPYGVGRLFGEGARAISAPYLDRDLLAFCASLPGALHAEGDLHDAAIARAFPEHAHLPYHQKDRSAKPGRPPLPARAAAWASSARHLAAARGVTPRGKRSLLGLSQRWRAYVVELREVARG